MASLANLPFDVLDKIFSSLSARDFLSVVSTCKLLYGNRLDSGFWRRAAQRTFRVRNRPSAEEDGKLWMSLYRRLLTQTRIAYWGQSRTQHERDNPEQPIGFIDRDPGEIIADLQCGGWSTTILNNHGVLVVSGDVDGILSHDEMNDDGAWLALGFPESEEERRNFLSPKRRITMQSDDARRIKQFSSGRSHILGLADDDTLWSWFDKLMPGVRIEFSDLFENNDPKPRISSVVAGWSKSSVYIRGTGIVVWDPVFDPDHERHEDIAIQITRSTPLWIVPGSSFTRESRKSPTKTANLRESQDAQGEIKNYIMLEHFAVFVTDTGKIFASGFESERSFEIPELQALSDTDSSPSATDVQGSFRSFVVFKRNGEVINSDQDYLRACEEREYHEVDALPSLLKIPALQNTGVISVAFGDYHSHALHSDGRITSYGREPQRAGSLGLSTRSTAELRGIVMQNAWGDGKLLPHAYFRGRQIWFHPMQHEWLSHLSRLKPKGEMSNQAWGELSEWVEQTGSDWHKKPGVSKKDEDGLGPYFALSVAAGGWRSGAIVLVNHKLVEAITDNCLSDTEDSVSCVWDDDSFPRIRLEDGTETPGTDQEGAGANADPLSDWKRSPPVFNLQENPGSSHAVFGIKGWEWIPDLADM